MDDGGKFHPAAFDRAVGSIKPTKSGRGGGGGRGRGGKGERGGRGGRGAQQQAATDCLKLIRTIVAKGMEPLLVFAFGTSRLTLSARVPEIRESTSQDPRRSPSISP